MKSKWFLTAATVLATVMALDILFLAAELVSSVVTAGIPNPGSDLAHYYFHVFEQTGFALMGAILLGFVAWTSIRKGEVLGFVVLFLGGAIAAALPVLGYARYGPWHDHVFQPAALWLLSVLAAGAGLLLKRRQGVRATIP